MHQIVCRWGSSPDPAGGAYNAPPDPLAGFLGPTSKGGKGKEREKSGREWSGEGKTPCSPVAPPATTF